MSDNDKPYSLRKHGRAPFLEGLPPTTRKRFQFSNSPDADTTVDSGVGKSLIQPELTSDEDSEEESIVKSSNNSDLDNLSVNTLVDNIENNAVVEQVNVVGNLSAQNQIDPNLINQIHQENLENLNNMDLAPNQNISLNDALTFVPRFDGVPSELTDFLNCCKDAKSVLPNAAESNLTKLIYGSKLSPKVRASLNSEIPNSIANLTTALKKIYVPSKTLFQLQGELGTIYQLDYESVVDFVNRLRKKGREIVECHAAANPNLTQEQSEAFKRSIDASISECFTQNLRNEIDQRMPVCANAEEALGHAIKIERKLNARKELRREPESKKSNKEHKKSDEKDKNSSKSVNFTTRSQNNSNMSNKPSTSQNYSKNKNNNSSTVTCYNCHQLGHIIKNCPDLQCQICFQKGHSAKNCPQLAGKNNQNNSYTRARCQLCGVNGHTAKYCDQNPNRVTSNVNSSPRNNNNNVNTGKFCNIHQTTSHSTEECKFAKQLQYAQQAPFPKDAGKNNRPIHIVKTSGTSSGEDSE